MIPYLDLKAQYRGIKDEIDAAVLGVLESSQFILGEEVAAFEREFATYCHASESVGVNSGTSALHLALLAAGIVPGDEVITTPFTFVATVAAIRYAGATPVLVDIEPDYFTLDPSRIESAITPRTRAIVPVHLYGQPADMNGILEIAQRRRLTVIEDAAQAHGSEYLGLRCGSLAEIATFSFYPGKNLGACGEGGAITTTRSDVAERCRVLRDWGQERRYEHRLKGFNYRMDAIQGAVLRVKLRHLEAWTEQRRQVARWYNDALDPESVRSPKERPGCRHVYHVYVVRSDDRDGLRDALAKQGVQTGVHYPIPVHLQPAHHDLGYHAGDFPVAEAVAREVLSLPIYPEMTHEQVQMVAAAVSEASQARTRG
jgi:dTDP-4-amino-4,6-dideoxygalactose transaminase